MGKSKSGASTAATLATSGTSKKVHGPKEATGTISTKPTPDMEIVHSISKSLCDDPESRFIFEMYWRARTLLDDTDLPQAAIAFEMMQSSFSAFENGLSHKDIAEGYPVTAWREDTVEIPRAWLRVLVKGWEKHKSGNAGSTLGEALGVEGGGQGKQPVREQLRNINSGIRISNKAMVEYLAERAQGGKGAWGRAFLAVAAHEGVSEDTVKRACKKHLKAKLSRAEYLQLLKMEGGKTS